MQSSQKNDVSRVTFGLFEADLKTGELWKAGYRVKLQALPFKVLTVLLEHAGEVVTRDELQTGVWGPDVVVDFEHALSNAIKKLREALSDSADNPRFIETLSRRGFRFIAPVGFIAKPSQAIYSTLEVAAALPAVTQPSAPAPIGQAGNSALTREPEARPNRYIVPALLFLLGGLIVGFAVQFWNGRRPPTALPRISKSRKMARSTRRKSFCSGPSPPLSRTAFTFSRPQARTGELLSQVSLANGASQTLPLPSQIGVPEVEDISPDGTHLLLRSNLGAASQQPLWIVPIDGGSAFRVSDVMAQSATWMPDARSVLFASGDQLSVVSLANGHSTPLATVPGRAFWPRWSPDGKLLRFTIIDALNHTSSLWQISKGQNVAHSILRGWTGGDFACCGTWTADGKAFVFEATRNGSTDLWKLETSSDSNPVRITNGPLNFKAPSPGRTGGEIFFIG